MNDIFLSTIISIQNKKGLHARAASKLVALANQFNCTITLRYKNRHANAKNMLEILTLATPYNHELTIDAQGEDAESAVSALVKLIEDKFGEDV